MTPNISIRHLSPDALRTMVALADHNSFAQAAASLHVTQAATSQQVKKLEDQLGLTLFSRSGRRMLLTEAGLLLVAHARKILALQQEAVLDLQGHKAGGTLRLGVPQDYAEDMLPLTLRRFSERFPRVHLEVKVEKNQTLIEEINQSRLDIVLALGTVNRLPAKPLIKPKIDWLVAKDFRWDNGDQPLSKTTKPEVPIILLDSPCIFRNVALEALKKHQVPYRVTYSTASLAGARAAVAAGLGVMARIQIRRDTDLGISTVQQTHPLLAKTLPKLGQLSTWIWHHENISAQGAELVAALEQTVKNEW
jgi:DNA-binding transcriptional LysR family regulator